MGLREGVGGLPLNTCLQKGLCVEGQVTLKGTGSSNRAAAGCKIS